MRNKIPLYETMTQYLNNFNDIHCIELDNLENDLSTWDEVKVVVLNIEAAYDVGEQLPLELVSDGKTFEIRCVISTLILDTRGGWKGEVFFWHGLSFKSFWYQTRGSYFPIKSHLPAKLDLGKA